MNTRSYFIITICLFLISCAASKRSDSPLSLPDTHRNFPDYSDLFYWAAHPAKKDPSDSTPAPYRNFTTDSSVDVFFIYPTSYVSDTVIDVSLLADSSERKRWNASLTDVALNAKTDNNSILFQASAFNHYRVFSPRYRQAHYHSFFISDSISKPFFDTAYTDIKNAFTYYLQHENNGRPFIIAAHSQGTVHAGRLIKEMIEQTPLADKLIAAYLVGIPVRETYFSNCLPCSTPTQTGCFVSWRTFKKNYEDEWVQREQFKAYVVNPLTWTMDTLPASRKLNRGAVLFKFNKPKPKAVSAVIHGNVLWSSKPHFLGSMFYTKKNYHIGDINLFWKNIRDNVDDRVNAYKIRHN